MENSFSALYMTSRQPLYLMVALVLYLLLRMKKHNVNVLHFSTLKNDPELIWCMCVCFF